MPTSIKKIFGDKDGKVFITLFDWKKDVEYYIKVHKQKGQAYPDNIEAAMKQDDDVLKKIMFDSLRAMKALGFIVWHYMNGKAYRAGIIYLSDMELGFDGTIHYIADYEHLRYSAKEKINDDVMAKAGKLFLGFVFNALNFVRVSAVCLLDNRLAINFIKKIGFKEEGIRRNSVIYNGKARNALTFGIIKDDIK